MNANKYQVKANSTKSNLTHEEIFINPNYENNQISKLPILLFDNSGSTNDIFLDKRTIFRSYPSIIPLLADKGIENVRIMLWSDKVNIIENIVSLDNLADTLYKYSSSGGTYLERALNAIPKEWINANNDLPVDIYIVTDGQVGDREHVLTNIIKHTFETIKNLNMYIITFEPTETNYNHIGCNVTSILYQNIQRNKLTNHIKQYLSYNRISHDVPFINFSNLNLAKGFIQFKNKCFHIDNLRKFIKYIDHAITITDDISNLNNLLFNCCPSVSQIIKHKPNIDKSHIIQLFSRIFSVKMNYNNVFNQITNEVNGIITGSANTYNQYIANRNNLFEKTNSDLEANVSSSIVVHNENYLTIPLPTKTNDKDYYDDYVMFECSNLNNFGNYRVGTNVYQKGAIVLNNYNLPILPHNSITTNTNTNQHIRQWIRAIYSNFYGIKANSDFLLYMFLTDMLKVIISNIGEEVKKVYRNLGLIMLDRVRFNSSGTKEIVFLLSGNAPLPNSGSETEMIEILSKCSRIAFGERNKLRPYTLWYAIILAIGKDELISNQLARCIEDICLDFTIEPKNLLNHITDKYNIKCSKQTIRSQLKLDYTCYLTLDDTSITGGLKVASHSLTKKSNVYCDPRYVISHEAFILLKNSDKLICPLCAKKLSDKDYVEILPVKLQNESQKETELIDSDKVIDWFKTNNHKVVSPTKMFYDIETSGFCNWEYQYSKLLPIEELDFNVKSYEFSDTIVTKSMDKINFTVNSSKAFKDLVSKNYSFLHGLNWNNICVAGGFIKSLLLDQPVNDIDIFMYGLDSNQTLLKVRHISNVLQNFFPDKYVLVANKKDTQVIEMLILDIITVDSALKEFEEKTKLSGLEEKIVSENSKINYFTALKNRTTDEATLNRFNVIQKIQIIVMPHTDIYDVINNFDLSSCMAAYDGNNLLFNEKGYLSYKYMFNVLKKDYNYSTLTRIIKYYNSGFNLVFHKHDTKNGNCSICNIYDYKYDMLDNTFVYRYMSGICKILNNVIKINSFRLTKNTDDTGTEFDNGHVHNKNKYDKYYSSFTNGTEKALSCLIKLVEIKNAVEKNNIVWDVYDLSVDTDIIGKFLEYLTLQLENSEQTNTINVTNCNNEYNV